MISDFVFLVAPFVVGMGSSIFTPKYKQCKNTPNTPKFQPPGYVFAIAWSIIYILFGISCYYSWTRAKRRFTLGLVSSLVLLSLLAIWGPIFFNYCLPALAFSTILGLLGMSVGTIIIYIRDREYIPAYLLFPLAAWLSFASYLSYASLELNTN